MCWWSAKLTLSLAAVAFKFHWHSEGLLINMSQNAGSINLFFMSMPIIINNRFLKRNVGIYVWNYNEFLHASNFSSCDICWNMELSFPEWPTASQTHKTCFASFVCWTNSTPSQHHFILFYYYFLYLVEYDTLYELWVHLVHGQLNTLLSFALLHYQCCWYTALVIHHLHYLSCLLSWISHILNTVKNEVPESTASALWF
jgi:hypothetical protein